MSRGWLITGGSRGLGLATARSALAAGSRVAGASDATRSVVAVDGAKLAQR